MKRPEGFDDRPDRPVPPSAAPDAPVAGSPAPGRRARLLAGIRAGRRLDDGLEARGTSATPGPASDTPGPERGPVRSTDAPTGPAPGVRPAEDRRGVPLAGETDPIDALFGASADPTPDTRPGGPADAGARGRAGEFAGAAGRRVGAGLSSGFASVAERLRQYSAPDDHRSAPDDHRGLVGGAEQPGPTGYPADPAEVDRDPVDDGDHDARVTDVLDFTRASRHDDGEADDHRADDHADTPIGARVLAAETAREARAARRRRRLLERAEVRRFTRRSRHRRAAWTTAAALVLVLGVSILVAVFSPLMALRTIEVKGADRVDASAIRQALSGQMGTPLARLDFGEVKRDLAAFPLIESYVTEEAPPHTLVVTITERTPVVAVQRGSGYELVDPAGIVVQRSGAAPEGLPVADVSATKTGSSVFRTMTEVVLALPSTVRTQVTGITASTADDVTLTMQDGSRVVWGSPDESPRKAALLAALVADHASRDPSTPVEYDVSAPENGIVRSQG